MIKVIVRVRDKSLIKRLEAYGSIVYMSPILNVIGIEINEKFIKEIEKDDNVLSWEKESMGNLMLT